ncbi:hypothetical protein IJ21_29840 [Paenibacillus sp. 32O-W]|jgi:hypothetical protein|nr:hypothetical protein IJ21_29840 [Paenibacillus sp. 32O-W]
MKKYLRERNMRLVGKAWEIRHHLRQLAKSPASRHITLHSYLAAGSPSGARRAHLAAVKNVDGAAAASAPPAVPSRSSSRFMRSSER